MKCLSNFSLIGNECDGKALGGWLVTKNVALANMIFSAVVFLLEELTKV